MIVSMKKITLIMQSKDAQGALSSLRDLGIVHIEHENIPTSEDINQLKDNILSLSQSILALADVGNQKTLKHNQPQFSRDILNLLEEKELLKEDIRKRQKDIDLWQEWGDFDPAFIETLKNKNLLVRLAKITKKSKREIPEDVIAEVLFKKRGFLYCALISQDNKDLSFKTLAPPKISLSSMLKEQQTDIEKIKDIEDKLIDYAKYKEALLNYKEHLKSTLQFQEVLDGSGKFQVLSYLKGYVPSEIVGLIEKRAEQEKWGIIIEAPQADDNVPTLIRNPRWVETIKPVFDMIKALPGYKEVDISLWFLLFFSAFFGILIGDAGYGAVIFLLNIFLHLKLKNTLKDTKIFPLMYILSGCAIIWGVFTGTFFGQAWLPKQIEPLMPFLSKSANVQALCFLIGALHLSIAHAWRGIIKFPHLKFLAEIGWICMLWGAFFLARVLILGDAFPVFAKWFLIAGAGLIIFFTNPTKNIFKSLGAGLGDFLLKGVNSFTDVVSYIRLFAVGTATVAVADAFNQMATANAGTGIFSGLVTALILIFGHSLNILLCAMAVLVHGVRLNVLEFSSHLNMEWAGVSYEPFKNRGV